MEEIRIKIVKKQNHFNVFLATENSSGIKERCRNTEEIGQAVRNYVVNLLIEDTTGQKAEEIRKELKQYIKKNLKK